jgi:hypothetical protein
LIGGKVKMNNELYAKAGKVTRRIEDLRKVIHNCERSIVAIGHGADFRILDNHRDIDISDCCLDDGQEKLMQDMFVTILQNRMEEAEAELEALLPKEEEDNE